MARPADQNSKRQRGFRILNQLYRAKTATRIARLMSELDVDRPYAETIIATHKRMAKAEGKFITTYRVVDQRNGKSCKPYLSSYDVYKAAVKKKDCLTPEAAKAVYMQEQQAKINLVKSL